jgi:hypothetical protein
MAGQKRFCQYCGACLTGAEGGEGNPRRRPSGWNTPIEMRGKRYGSLVVLDMVQGVTPRKWRCSCDCGKSKAISGDNLRRGLVRSCGCLRKARQGVSDNAPAV